MIPDNDEVFPDSFVPEPLPSTPPVWKPADIIYTSQAQIIPPEIIIDSGPITVSIGHADDSPDAKSEG